MEINMKGGMSVLILGEASVLIKCLIPSMFMVLAMELYIESLFIRQQYKLVRWVSLSSKGFNLFGLCRFCYNRFDNGEYPEVSEGPGAGHVHLGVQ
jgi:hypothetical protein